MKKVVVYSNWCYVDQLDGRTLNQGERLRVRWSDGHESIEAVVIMDKSHQAMDHGSPYTLGVIEAYAPVRVYGSTGLVRLANSDLLCERV